MDREKSQFAARLHAALQAKGIEVSATALEKRFNSRYQGTPVTAQAISGWLNGRYIPKQDKLRVLAGIVGMDLHALRYGPVRPVATRVAEDRSPWPAGVGGRERQIIDAFLALSPRRQELVSELIGELGKIEKK